MRIIERAASKMELLFFVVVWEHSHSGFWGIAPADSPDSGPLPPRTCLYSVSGPLPRTMVFPRWDEKVFPPRPAGSYPLGTRLAVRSSVAIVKS